MITHSHLGSINTILSSLLLCNALFKKTSCSEQYKLKYDVKSPLKHTPYNLKLETKSYPIPNPVLYSSSALQTSLNLLQIFSTIIRLTFSFQEQVCTVCTDYNYHLISHRAIFVTTHHCLNCSWNLKSQSGSATGNENYWISAKLKHQSTSIWISILREIDGKLFQLLYEYTRLSYQNTLKITFSKVY